MYSRKEQYEVINRVNIRDDETKRTDCPFCGGKYTLTITKRDGGLIWNCYKASCSASGAKRVGYGLDALKRKVEGLKPNVIERRTTPLPNVTSSIENHDHAMEYLYNNNCDKAYEDKAIKITYDPGRDRILFWMNKNEGAVGRGLSNNIKPKWLSYGNTTGVLSVGTAPTAIVVEDAASACSVYATGKYTGVALLGTNLSSLQRKQLSYFKSVIICLDKDASKKAIKLNRGLSGYTNSSVRFIDEDFKNMSRTSILEVVNEMQRTSGN